MNIRTVVVAVIAATSFGLLTESIQAQGSLTNNLFAQYTTQGSANMTNAGMYPAPHWVPRQMGHTYYTYQPLMPHEMMYPHSRNYYNYYGGADQFYANKYGHGGGSALNKTTVVWQNGCNHMAPLPGNRFPFAGLHYKLAAYKYCINSGGGASCNRFLGGGGLHGKFGCKSCGSTNCDGSCCSDCYGGEIYSAPAGGCADGCSAKLPETNINR